MPTTAPRRQSAITHLHQLLDHYSQITTAIGLTLGLIEDDAEQAARPRMNKVVSQALLHEVTRVGKAKGHPKKAAKKYAKSRPGAGSGSAIRKQRQRSAGFLARFDMTTPIPAPSGRKMMGALVRRGYLAKKGDGYVRTDKEYVV